MKKKFWMEISYPYQHLKCLNLEIKTEEPLPYEFAEEVMELVEKYITKQNKDEKISHKFTY